MSALTRPEIERAYALFFTEKRSLNAVAMSIAADHPGPSAFITPDFIQEVIAAEHRRLWGRA